MDQSFQKRFHSVEINAVGSTRGSPRAAAAEPCRALRPGDRLPPNLTSSGVALGHPTHSATSILVLDGEERASLAVVRSLVDAGYRVHAAARRRWSLAGAARGAHPILLRLDPLRDARGYAAEVAEYARLLGARLVVPVTDASADAVLEHRGLLPTDTLLPFASRETYLAASDKVRVHRTACAVGIGIEETAIVGSVEEGAPDDPRLYPGYVKPHRSVVGEMVRTKLGVRRVADRDECARVLADLPRAAFPVLVQRRVVGPGEGVFVARWGGKTIARFAHRRLREKPPGGGVSVFRESVAMDPAVLAACEALLDRLGWEGVAMVEGKRDVERGGWRVMEINGRFWGSLQLAVDAGVDFPAILASAALGGAVGEPPEWRAGLRLRWEWGDLDHLLIRMLRSRESLSLPADAPGRLGALGAFLRHRPGRDRLEVFRLRDPLPFVVETLLRIGVGR